MDGHDRIQGKIQDFLAGLTVPSLMSREDRAQGEGCIKAGVVPFVGLPRSYLFMKPVAKRSGGLGPPDFQLCKGTRMMRLPDGRWQDMRDGQKADAKETLAQTALREGIEELGLKLESIRRLIEVGPYGFASAKTGKRKSMWLFAAELSAPGALLPMAEVAPTTSERGWLTLAEFEVVGRADHRHIIRDIEAKLHASD